MDFSNEDLRKLISDKFKGYEVVPCYSSDIVWEHESTREIELHHCVKATDYVIAYYDIDLKKFRGRLFSENFETELEAVKDFHDRVLKLVAEKETEQKNQSELDEGGKIMDKEKIVDQLQKKMEKKYLNIEIEGRYGTLALKVGDKIIAYFRDWDADLYYMECGPELTEWALSNSILLEFYEAGRKLLEKPIKKYTIQVLPNEEGYLHVDHKNETYDEVSYSIGRLEDSYYSTQTNFTTSEIEELKKRDDIAVDWDKVELEEVYDAE